MQKYLTRRLLLAIPTLFGVTVLIFVVMRILPGDPLRVVLGAEGELIHILSDEELAAARASLGLDKPLVLQYGTWIVDIFKGDLGTSFWRGDSVAEVIMRRGPITVQIAVMAVVISWIVGLPVGILSSVRRNSMVDYATRGAVTLGLAMPAFWIGTIIITLGVILYSYHPPIGAVHFWNDPWGSLELTFFPVLAVSVGMAAVIARFVRATMLEVLAEDYVRTAQAKGLSQRSVVVRHAVRNAMLPVITVSGLQLGGLLGGSVTVERAFAVPGLGTELVNAIAERDWTMIQNITLMYAVVFVMANLLVDISYALFDPRVRFD